MSAKCTLVTTIGVQVENIEISCRVPNFTKHQNSDAYIQSQQFEFETGSKFGQLTKWRFCLQPCSYLQTKCLGGFIQLVDKSLNTEKLVATFSTKIKHSNDVSNRFAETTGIEYQFHKNGDCSQTIILFDPSADLTDVLVDDVLEIHLEFQALHFQAAEASPELRLEEKLTWFLSRSHEKLKRDLSLAQKADSEYVKLVSPSHEEFSIKRGLLSVRSHELQRVVPKVVGAKISLDVSSETFWILKDYLLKGILLKGWTKMNVFEELLYITKQYELKELREFLEESLVDLCAPQNCLRLARLANRERMLMKERACLEYFKKNVSSVEQVDWNGLTQEEGELISRPKRKRQ